MLIVKVGLIYPFSPKSRSLAPVFNWDRTPGDKTDGVYQTRDYAEVKIRDPGNLDRNLAQLEKWRCDKGCLIKKISNVLQVRGICSSEKERGDGCASTSRYTGGLGWGC